MIYTMKMMIKYYMLTRFTPLKGEVEGNEYAVGTQDEIEKIYI